MVCRKNTWLNTVGSYHQYGLNTCWYCDKHTKCRSIWSCARVSAYPFKQYNNFGSTGVLWVVESSLYALQNLGCPARPIRIRIGEPYNDTINLNAKNLEFFKTFLKATY